MLAHDAFFVNCKPAECCGAKPKNAQHKHPSAHGAVDKHTHTRARASHKTPGVIGPIRRERGGACNESGSDDHKQCGLRSGPN